MLWRVLDTVEELLEVVVPHLNNQHLSHPPKKISLSEPCLYASLLEDLSPSWKTSLDDLLQLQDDRACPAAVSLALESRDRSRVGPECRTGLPLQTPIPAPRSSHGRSNLTLLHPKKCTLDAMRNKLWESEKYSWTSTVGLSLSKCPFLPPHSSHGQSDSTALRRKERESEKYSWTMKWKCSSLHPAPPKGGLTWLYCIRAGKNWV